MKRNKVLTFINSSTNNQETATTIAEEGYISSGTIEPFRNIVSVRNARIQNKLEFEEQAVARTTGTQLVNTVPLEQLGSADSLLLV